MAKNFLGTAVNAGVQSGLNTYATMKGMKQNERMMDMREQQFDSQQELQQLELAIKNLGLEEAKDEAKRRKIKDGVRLLKYSRQASQNPETAEAWQQEVEQNPELQNKIMGAYQLVFGGIAQRGGPEGARKTPSRIEPNGDGTYTGYVFVEPPDGEAYEAPITTDRQPGGEPARIPAQDIMAHIDATGAVLDVMDKYYNPVDPSVQNRMAINDHETENRRGLIDHEYDRRERLEEVQSRYGTGGKSLPANIQTIEYLATYVTNGDRERAARIANQSKSDPRNLYADIYMDLLKSNNESLRPRPPGEIEAEANQIFQSMMNNPALNPWMEPEQPNPGAQGGQLLPPAGAGAARPPASPSQGGPGLAPPATPQAPGQQAQSQQTQIPPPAALRQLSEGKVTTFNNGQRWTLKDGQPVRVQ